MTIHGIGIIGTGWGARVQIPAFRAAGLEVVALAGSQAEKTTRIAADMAVPFATADWRALLARNDVALVSIVTPPKLHCTMAMAALEAGKHVLCEKPTAMDAAEAMTMLLAAQRHPERLALIDHELRFHPSFGEARRLIASGVVGTIRYVEVRLVASGRADPQRAWNWWSDAAQGGGALGAIGSHQIDSVRFLLNDEVAAVRGLVHTFIDRRPTENGAMRRVTADDFCIYQLRMRGGVLVNGTASLVARSDEPNSLTFYGTTGSLRFSAGQLLHATGGEQWHDITPAHRLPIPEGISGEFPVATVYLAHALKAALAGERQALAPAATFADGLAIQRVLDAARAGNNQGWSAINTRQ